MKSFSQKPAWRLLDLIFISMLGLIALGAWRSRPEGEHAWQLVIIISVGYGLVALWIYTNRAALSLLDAHDRRIRPPLHITAYQTREDSSLEESLHDEDEEAADYRF